MTFSCSFASIDYDVNDAVSYTAEWFINGVSEAVHSGITQPAQLDTTPYKGGDHIMCRVTPTDGDDDGQSMEATVILSSPLDTVQK